MSAVTAALMAVAVLALTLPLSVFFVRARKKSQLHKTKY
jgi:hypothetical protein